MPNELPDRQTLVETFLTEISRWSTWTVVYHQAASMRMGLNPTDLKTGALLRETGPITAGELADLIGLTTGAITGVLDRLEKAGVVRREHDPHDRRRVIIHLTENPEYISKAITILGGLQEESLALLAGYTDEQIALINGFIIEGREIMRRQTARLREAASAEQG